jgi:hypothetical protein
VLFRQFVLEGSHGAQGESRVQWGVVPRDLPWQSGSFLAKDQEAIVLANSRDENVIPCSGGAEPETSCSPRGDTSDGLKFCDLPW